jgi:RNA polymerase sigma-70 factor, ECF subfamily
VGPEPRPDLTKWQLRQVEDLYRQEADDLYKYACSISCGCGSEAWDLVQTAFQEAIRAWQQVGPYGPDEHRKWLRRVLRNKAIDLWRKQNVIALAADVSHPHPHCRSDDPGEHAELTLALAGCWKVIEQMPPTRRMVAALVWGKSWPPTRVAEHLGVAPSTVRGHLREARRQLRATVGHLVPFIDDEEGQEPAP